MPMLLAQERPLWEVVGGALGTARGREGSRAAEEEVEAQSRPSGT